jgi:WD40 repeat protein
MRFLFVGSRFVPPASFGSPFAAAPLPSARTSVDHFGIMPSWKTVTLVQGTFTSQVHAHAGRTQRVAAGLAYGQTAAPSTTPAVGGDGERDMSTAESRRLWTRLFVLLALAGIVIAFILSVWDIGLFGHLHRTVVRVVFSPDGKTLGAAVFSGRRIQAHDLTPRLSFEDQQMEFYIWDPHLPSRPSFFERAAVPGTRCQWAAEINVSGPSMAFSADRQTLATANGAYEVSLWRLQDKKRLATFRADDQLLCAVTFSPDGRDLIAGGMNGVHVWHIDDPHHEVLWMRNLASVCSFALSSNGRYLLSSDQDGNIDLWSLASKEYLTRICKGDNAFQLSPVAFSCDGRLFAAPTSVEEGNHVRPQLTLWDTATQKRVRSFDTRRFPFSAAFAPNGNSLFLDDGLGTLLLNDLTTGEQRAITCDSPVRTLAISPDGQELATGDNQGNVVLWDSHTMQKLARFQLSSPARPYWLIPLAAFFLWVFMWFRIRTKLSEHTMAANSGQPERPGNDVMTSGCESRRGKV